MTRRSLITVLLLTLFAVGYSGNAEAQFWKRKKKHKTHQKKTDTTDKKSADNEEDTRAAGNEPKEHVLTKKEKKELRRKEKLEKKEREKKERREKKEKEAREKKNRKKGKTAPIVSQPENVVRKWSDIDYAPTQKKDRYRVELLAPLYLDELVKNGYAAKDIPAKAQDGINFYKGVQIAADSLKKAGFNIDIYVRDIASIMESCDMLVRKNALDTSDLLIGVVAPKDVPVLANYAKNKHINFISASSAADGSVRDNPYFTMLQPSARSQCEWIAGTIEDKHAKAVILHRTYIQADDYAYHMLTDDTNYRKLFVPVLCNNLPKKQDLAGVVDTTRTNIVVVPVMDNVYADSLLKVLRQNFPRVKFEVYGMPSWSNMPAVSKPGTYPNISVNVPASFIYDPANPTVQYIDRIFRKEYGGKPQEMVYRGYETLFWYANLLKRHGTVFNKHFNEDELAPMTKFEIRPQWDKTGNVLYMENKKVFVRRYETGSF
jgi:hypothetical protein